MLDSSTAAEELVIAASQKLKLNLGLNEVELLKGIVIPLLGQDIFVAGRDQVAAVEIPNDQSELRDWKTIEDRRYLVGAMQIVMRARLKRIDEARRAELQTALALVFHAIRA